VFFLPFKSEIGCYGRGVGLWLDGPGANVRMVVELWVSYGAVEEEEASFVLSLQIFDGDDLRWVVFLRQVSCDLLQSNHSDA